MQILEDRKSPSRQFDPVRGHHRLVSSYRCQPLESEGFSGLLGSGGCIRTIRLAIPTLGAAQSDI